MGLIEVKTYTSAAQIHADAIARRARLWGKPAVHNLLAVPPVEEKTDALKVDWSKLPIHTRCKMMLDNYVVGDTYKTLADRINRKHGTDATRCALAGLRDRNKDVLSKIEFNSKGIGKLPWKKPPPPKPVPTPEDCAEAVDRSGLIIVTEDEQPYRRVFAEKLINEMCAAYRVDRSEITSRRRDSETALYRQKMMWVVKKLTPLTYPHIGRKFGGRDHTTVIHAIRKIDALIASNDPRVADLKGWLND
jgi:hypothetical protein